MGTFIYNSESTNDLQNDPNDLQIFVDATHNKGAPLENCWEFADGTVRPLCKPG